MKKPAVYLETSVIGYANSRPSRDLVIAGRQQITREWFTERAQAFDLFVSQLVLNEAAGGDTSAAADRLQFLAGIPVLKITESVQDLAATLVDNGVVPKQAVEDALHIAIATANGVEYLLTWNCKHIANATMRLAIEDTCRQAGYEPTVICTPEELSDDLQ